MLTAITRGISPSFEACELTFLPRRRVDVAKAAGQHRAYEQCLTALGLRVISLPAEPGLPDAVFIEDTAVVLDEIAVLARPGPASRQPEVEGVAEALSPHRPLKFLNPPATLEGGDVLRAGRTLYVGVSRRTNLEGLAQLRELVAPYDYQVVSIAVTGCLHLKTACSHLGGNTFLINRRWIDAAPLDGLDLIDVPVMEPWAANVLVMGREVLLPAGLPEARRLLERGGFRVRTLDISELQKAEAGLTCLSLIFESAAD